MATRKKRAPAKRVVAKRKRAKRAPAAKKVAAKKIEPKKIAPKKSHASKPVKTAIVQRARKIARSVRAATKSASGKIRGIRRAPAAQKAAPTRPAKSAARKTQAPVDASLFPCGDAAVRAATGKGWSEWLAVLDAAGAAKNAFDHQRVWELAMQSLPESAGWWGQMVSVGYERARGLREKHESCNGEFQSTLSKTLAVPLFAAFAAWADAGLRRNWLDAPGLNFTRLNAGKNIRARWPDGALLDIRFNASGPDKCQIVVDTMKLLDAQAVSEAKAFWQAQFERLQAYLRA